MEMNTVLWIIAIWISFCIAFAVAMTFSPRARERLRQRNEGGLMRIYEYEDAPNLKRNNGYFERDL